MYDIYEELNRITDYIEEHILEDIDIKTLAKMAKLNSIALNNVFNCLTGTTIMEYIRFRRLSLSVSDILNGESITSVAYKYLYNSPSSFNRAFKRYQGMTPREIKNSRNLRLFNKITFKEKLTNYDLDYKIYKNKSITLYGVSTKIDLSSKTVEIPAFWKRVKKEHPEFRVDKRYGFLDKFSRDSSYYCLLENEFTNSTKVNIPKSDYFAIKTESFSSENIITNIDICIGEYIRSLNYKVRDLPKIEVYSDNYVEILIPIT